MMNSINRSKVKRVKFQRFRLKKIHHLQLKRPKKKWVLCRKKKFGRKKGKKAKSADRDFDDFENPLATDDVQYADT